MFEKKEIKAGGNTYHVHEISVRHRRDIFASYKNHNDATTMSIDLVLAGCDEFKDKDSDAVLELPGSVFDKITSEITELSGMGVEKEGDKKNE